MRRVLALICKSTSWFLELETIERRCSDHFLIWDRHGQKAFRAIQLEQRKENQYEFQRRAQSMVDTRLMSSDVHISVGYVDTSFGIEKKGRTQDKGRTCTCNPMHNSSYSAIAFVSYFKLFLPNPTIVDLSRMFPMLNHVPNLVKAFCSFWPGV